MTRRAPTTPGPSITVATVPMRPDETPAAAMAAALAFMASPSLSADGRWVLSYNGEIYNHAQLREELEAARGGVETDFARELFA